MKIKVILQLSRKVEKDYYQQMILVLLELINVLKKLDRSEIWNVQYVYPIFADLLQ